MKKKVVLAGLLAFGLVTTGATAVSANTSTSNRPAWITADGKPNLNKMPDNAKIPYKCWNGRQIELSGRQFRQKMNSDPKPGSAEHELSMAKANELKKIPGIVTVTPDGKETILLDDTNPEVEKIMQTYESKETPQCQ